MSKSKNQHYVPQSYLTRFTSGGGQIFSFDKFSKRSFKTNIRNVASETYFYDVSENQINELLKYIQENLSQFHDVEGVVGIAKSLGTIEQQLSEIESQLKIAMDELIASIEKNTEWFSTPPAIHSLETNSSRAIKQITDRLIQAGQVDPKYKFDVAFLIALQMVRTREQRESLVEYMEKSITAVSELMLKIIGVKENIDVSQVKVGANITPETAQLLHLQYMLNPDAIHRIISTLMDHIWIFEVNHTSQPFFTSDNPVAIVPNKPSTPGRHYTGYASEGIEIRFTLTPKLAITFYEKIHFSQLAQMEGKVIPLDEKYVTRHNKIQIKQSYRQIYCSANPSEIIEKICKENPQLCDPETSRFKIIKG